MKANEFASKLKEIATNYETLYVYGCFGACLKESNKSRYTTNSAYEYNKRPDVIANINKAVAKGNVFGFDCVCLLKGLLWGWNGNKSATYGGAVYKSNGVPDYNADGFFNRSKSISTDFSKIEVGEAVWLPGHIGVYIGDGLAVECTPSWKNCVQITACNCTKTGYPTRTWEKHGKLPYVDYDVKEEVKTEAVSNRIVVVDLPVLRKGDSGKSVEVLQRLLKSLGYKGSNKLALTTDGKFGGNTEYALRSYQKAKGLEADGICGKNSWEKILKG